jgi:2-dehydro-3-deoxyphosphogluconate aldolase / (4S)-4-hydroxy-2-oxoglutarate aldolase
MMTRQLRIQKLIDTGAIAVIRMSDPEKLRRVVDAIREGGVDAIEITMTTPGALSIIEEMAKSNDGSFHLGVGSVLDAETARLAIGAGAQFVVSPVMKPEIIHTAHKYDCPAMPGGFTPTEILSAHEHGADIVKVFPADVLGMAFFKAIKAPMPQLKLMPTGGVSLTNAGDWLKAGACAVGIGGALLDSKAIAEGTYTVLTDNARILIDSIQKARS